MAKHKDETRNLLQRFLELESASGILLMLAAMAALVFANTPLSLYYDTLLDTQVTVMAGDFGIAKPLIYWINDGLMAIFFLVVGMEIKREVMAGQLSSVKQAMLPVVAAVGGVMCPALIYWYFNADNATAMRGWAIPSATDIAFSLGVLSLFGSRVPLALKVFLMAVAVIDDLMAIIIIALFYTDSLSIKSLGIAAACLLCLYILNDRKVNRMMPYMIIGLIMWVSVLKSGVHATIAGVLLGLFIPLKLENEQGKSLLDSLIHTLHPWVAYLILPIFAFANSGITLGALSPSAVTDPVVIGIAAGLFFGKQWGIFAFSWLMIKLGLAPKLEGVNWWQFYGVCVIAGIGFTMSLFIGTLAFTSEALRMEVRLGVLGGSFVSAVMGYIWLAMTLEKKAVAKI